VSPDTLTLISLVISGVSLPLAAFGICQRPGAALVVGAAFDALDGIVAREQGIASDSGEVLDAVVDRYADAAPLLAWRCSIARQYQRWCWCWWRSWGPCS